MKTEYDELIFVVDDDPVYLKVVQHKLEQFRCKNVKTYVSAVDCIKDLKLKPDIVFLDFWLDNNITGLSVLKKIKKESPKTKVIFLSGTDDIEIAVETMKHGAYDYVVKGDTSQYYGSTGLDKAAAFIRIKHLIKKISADIALQEEKRAILRTKILLFAGIVLFVTIILLLVKFKIIW